MGVMTPSEATARTDVLYEQYVGVVEMEAKCMISMITQHVEPSCKKAGLLDSVSKLKSGVSKLESTLAAMNAAPTMLDKATAARALRLETMEAVRQQCDAAEALVPPELWTLAT